MRVIALFRTTVYAVARRRPKGSKGDKQRSFYSSSTYSSRLDVLLSTLIYLVYYYYYASHPTMCINSAVPQTARISTEQKRSSIIRQIKTDVLTDILTKLVWF